MSAIAIVCLTFISEHLMKQTYCAQAEKTALFIKNLASAPRLMILCVLSDGAMTVGSIEKRLTISQSALSQHLARLRKDGLVQARREKKQVYYSLTETPAFEIIKLLRAYNNCPKLCRP